MLKCQGLCLEEYCSKSLEEYFILMLRGKIEINKIN
jgi:hypothetical protein